MVKRPQIMLIPPAISQVKNSNSLINNKKTHSSLTTVRLFVYLVLAVKFAVFSLGKKIVNVVP